MNSVRTKHKGYSYTDATGTNKNNPSKRQVSSWHALITKSNGTS